MKPQDTDLDKDLHDTDVSTVDVMLLQAVEELRLRRAVEGDKEKKIQGLMDSKQQLEKKLDQEMVEYKCMKISYEHKLTDLRKTMEEKVSKIGEEKMKVVLNMELLTKQLENLEKDHRAVHLERGLLEEKYKEQEAKLQQQIKLVECGTSQLTMMRTIAQGLGSNCSDLAHSQALLTTNVNKAVSFQKDLESNAKLLLTRFEVLERENIQLKEEIVKLRVERASRTYGASKE